MTLEEKIAQEKKLEELRRRNREEYQKVRTAFQAISADGNFQIVLRHLAKISGFFKSDIVINPTTNEINPLSTLHNQSRRTVYLDLRRMMTDETRRLIESKGEDDHG